MELREILLAGKLSGSGGGGGSSGGNTGGDNFPIGDGNTHIWISLAEGRTSPCVGFTITGTGTVTVDWGDGSAPDTLTCSDTSLKVMQNHNYGKAGDYVITVAVVSGIMYLNNKTGLVFNSTSSSDSMNKAYSSCVTQIELGVGVMVSGTGALQDLPSLRNVSFFGNNGTDIAQGNFYNCYALWEIAFPDGCATLGNNTCYGCRALQKAVFPASVTSIGMGSFGQSVSLKLVDFSKSVAVPSLGSISPNFPSDCQIRVPAALVDEWKAATNWATYADYIVGV